MPDAVTVRLARTAMVLGLLAVPLLVASPAGAAISNFTVSSTSGPPGTVVAVSGTGCAPGLLLSSILDYVQITVTTVPPTTAHVRVGSSGSWHGSFTVPANAAAAPAAVSALCVSDGLQSLLTLYTPKTFTVTGPATVTIPPVTIPPTTVPVSATAPPTTAPRRPTTSTTPRRSATTVPTGTTPSTGGTVPSTLPGATPGAHGGGGASGPAATATHPTATTGTHAQAASTKGAVYAADLDAPDAAGVNAPGGSGGLGWLPWLLLAGVLLLVLAPIGWRWVRASDEPVEPNDA